MTLNNILFDNFIFGILISILAFTIFSKVFQNTTNPLFNPLLFSIAAIILILKTFQIPLESYNKGGDVISFLLGPTTVALAIPLYKKINLLKQHFIPIMVGVTVGCIVGIVSVVIMGKFLGLDDVIIKSLAPKATTTAIATELSHGIGGNPSITLAFVTVAGFFGYLVGEQIMKIFKIKNATAKGIAIGTASHAFGTNKALEMGAEEGAMSSLAIGLAGIITSILLPLLLKIMRIL